MIVSVPVAGVIDAENRVSFEFGNLPGPATITFAGIGSGTPLALITYDDDESPDD